MIENEEAEKNRCIDNGQEWNNLQMNDNRLWFGSRVCADHADSGSEGECSELPILIKLHLAGLSLVHGVFYELSSVKSIQRNLAASRTIILLLISGSTTFRTPIESDRWTQ